jgi:hypothetical protein
MNIDVVHDYDIATPEDGNQALLDIGQEHLCVHGPTDHHRGDHFVVTQGGHKGDRTPFSTRGVPDEFDASRTATPEPHHLGGDRSLIDEHQVGGVKQALLSHPAAARQGDVGAVLFRRPQTLFF